MAKTNRPIGITALSIFFMAATAITLVASVSLLLPNGTLEQLWRLNPRGRAGLAMIGIWAVILLFAVGAACAMAAIGLWHGYRWGYWLALIILAVNLIGGFINVVFGLERKAAFGIPVVMIIIGYLARPPVRRFFKLSRNKFD